MKLISKVTIKSCGICHADKNILDFNKDSKSKDGFSYKCRTCAKEIKKIWYAEHSEEENTKSKEYYLKNKDTIIKRRSRWQKLNKERLNEASRKYYYDHQEDLRNKARNYGQLNRLQRKNYVLKTKYGITLDQRTALLKEQNYKCAITDCKVTDTDVRMLGVDHNHSTGATRGLLCDKHNMFIGVLESPELQFLIDYLNKHETRLLDKGEEDIEATQSNEDTV